MGSGDQLPAMSRRCHMTAEAPRRRGWLRRPVLCAASCAIGALLGRAGWYGAGERVPEPGVEHDAIAAPAPPLPRPAGRAGPKTEPLAWLDDLDAVQIGPELGPARQVQLLVPARTEREASVQTTGERHRHPFGAGAAEGGEHFENADLHSWLGAGQNARAHSVKMRAKTSQVGL